MPEINQDVTATELLSSQTTVRKLMELLASDIKRTVGVKTVSFMWADGLTEKDKTMAINTAMGRLHEVKTGIMNDLRFTDYMFRAFDFVIDLQTEPGVKKHLTIEVGYSRDPKPALAMPDFVTQEILGLIVLGMKGELAIPGVKQVAFSWSGEPNIAKKFLLLLCAQAAMTSSLVTITKGKTRGDNSVLKFHINDHFKDLDPTNESLKIVITYR